MLIESLMSGFAVLITVFGWAFFSFWSAIPAGLALSVSPLAVAATVTISYASGVALVLGIGAPLRDRIQKRIQPDPDAKPRPALQRIQKAWDRYGLWGLAILAPMTVGAQVGAVIGLSLGVRPLALLLALTSGAAFWAAAITLAISLGLVTLAG